jgi:hypothetical protein
MDGARFDRLAAAWAARHSRRRALALLGSGALAAGLGLTRPEPAAARCRHAHNCAKHRTVTCHSSLTCLLVKNVDTGACACVEGSSCGIACRTGSECASGQLCVFAKKCCDTGKWCAAPCRV